MTEKYVLRDFAARLYRGYKRRHFPYSAKERRHDFIFIHIPKSGGTALRTALGYSKTGRQHLPWYVYYSANPNFFERSFKFAIVRNPWDRAVSAYHYLAQGGNGTTDSRLTNEISKYKDFSDFVLSGLSKGTFRSNLMFLPQSNFIVDGESEIKVDFVGRLENLNEDFQQISKRLSFSAQPISHINKSSRSGGYRQYYLNDDVVTAIMEIYQQDIRTFGYSFGGCGE